MTKKDYKLIAGAINKIYYDTDKILLKEGLDGLVGILIYELKLDNSLFNPDKFVKACFE